MDGANEIAGDKRFILEHLSRGYLITDNDMGTETECINLDEVIASEEYANVYFTIVGK